MRDWARSVSILSAAFVGTVLLTFGLVVVMVPGAFGPSPDADPAAPSVVAAALTPAPLDQVPTEIGGTLTVSGDVEGTLQLDREDAEIGFVLADDRTTARLEDGPYRLIGDDGLISFGLDPLIVEQIDFGGLAFYPERDECSIIPGVLNSALGIASGRLQCVEIADIRGDGVATFDGTIMVSGDLLGMRAALPPSGGSIAVGPATIELSEARLLLEPFGFDAATGLAHLPLFAADGESGLILRYDPETHELSLGTIVVDGESADVAGGACEMTRRDIGLLNPRTSVVELSTECDAVEIPGLGSVAVEGAVVVDLIGVDAAP